MQGPKSAAVAEAPPHGLVEQRLECWGSDECGAVGDGPPIGATQPTPIAVGAAATRWRSLSDHGAAHQCGLREDGTAWCWGHNGLDHRIHRRIRCVLCILYRAHTETILGRGRYPR